MIQRNISQLTSFSDMTVLRASCGCMSNEHDHNIMIEVCKETKSVYVSIDLQLSKISDSTQDSFAINLWARLKNAFLILFTGAVEVNHVFYFADEAQARAYTESINNAIDTLKQFSNENTTV